MNITSITIKPVHSGCTVRVAEKGNKWHDHAFTRGAEAIDFIAGLMALHDRGTEIAAKSPKKQS